jgi:hypothetical protein
VRKERKIVFAIAAMFAIGAMLATTLAAQNEKAAPNTTQKERSVLIGEDEAKKLLLLMDTDKSGKVSKQEFLAFMGNVFDNLDKNKDGELDVKELTEMHLRLSQGFDPGRK